jgi:putative ABC transport system permease protein
MTGMILAGASPLAAIRLQLLVMYMLLGGNAFAALVSGELTLRRLFTADHQLIRTLRRTPPQAEWGGPGRQLGRGRS